MSKRLLILGGPTPICKVVNAAKEMGIYTIVTDMADNAPAKKLADEALPYSVMDYESLIAWCKENPIDGVINFCVGLAQETHYRIANEFGLPCYGTPEQYETMIEKDAFKKLCADNNVDTIPGYEIGEEDKFEFPILVKPADSSGSRGAAVCYNMDDYNKYISIAKEESTSGNAIIEKYMADCQDLTVSYLIKDGNPVLISIGDRYPGREEDGLNRQLSCTIQPSRFAEMYMEKVDGRVVKMLQNLGLVNGAVFMQGFVDGDTVRFYDPAIRFPGNDYEMIYEKATGMSPMKSLISFAMGEGIDDYDGKIKGSYMLSGKCAIQYIINAGPGEIASYDGLDEVAKLPYVVDVKQRFVPGYTVKSTGDVRQRAGEVSILIDRDANKMKEAIDTIQSLLSMKDVNGNNQLVSAYDSSIVLKNY